MSTSAKPTSAGAQDLQHTVIEQAKKITILEEIIQDLRVKLYGRKADKWSAADLLQGRLFNEAEDGNAPSAASPQETVSIPAHQRAKGKRSPLPADLPRIIVPHDIPDEQKTCSCGNPMSRIGEETSEQLDIIPMQFRVIRHVRPKYACRACQGVDTEGATVKIAPPAAQLIPKSIATPGLLAYLMAGKFTDGLPFYRQEKILSRYGVELSRATMCSWAVEVASLLSPLLKLIERSILEGPYMQVDETRLQVLREQDRKAEDLSYMWVYRAMPPGKIGILFRYHPSRSGDIPWEFLQGYHGAVQTDGYKGYNKLKVLSDNIVLLGCWAHARRKFVDVTKASGTGGAAHEALRYIHDFYEVEHSADRLGLSPEERVELRRQKAAPILYEFKLWLEAMGEKTPPQGLLGKAIGYTLGEWERLTRYLDNGILRLDNNQAVDLLESSMVIEDGKV